MRIHLLPSRQLEEEKVITFDVYILVNKSASNAFISSSESGNKPETYVYYFIINLGRFQFCIENLDVSMSFEKSDNQSLPPPKKTNNKPNNLDNKHSEVIE